MLTLKTGVPGSGKTQSMVAELLAMVDAWKKDGNVRPIYTNITGLDQTMVPHTPMLGMVLGDDGVRRWPERKEGQLYTRDWALCPPGSVIVIDEAQDNGYESLPTQSRVPDYIARLATHRKDYAVDIWFITQHPRLIHVSARRQIGKHQHYERKFGMSPFVFEWHHCEDMLAQRKTAVMSRFKFSKRVQGAYLSASEHTKQSFKLPMWVWLPIGVIPLAVWAVPTAFSSLYSAMSGQGVPGMPKPLSAASAPAPVASAPQRTVTVTTAPSTVPVVVPPDSPAAPASSVMAGCIAVRDICRCFDVKGSPVTVTAEVCIAAIPQGPVADIGPDTVRPVDRVVPGDYDTLAWLASRRGRR